MNGHTPGPWGAYPHWTRSDEYHITDKGGVGAFAPIAKVKGDKRDTLHQLKDNARLIAAAPDMLLALQLIEANAADSIEWIRSIAKGAINKATTSVVTDGPLCEVLLRERLLEETENV